MNSKRILFILFVILAQALAACSTPAPTPAPVTPTSAPTLAPTVTPTPEPPDSAEVVQNFWDAMKAQDVNAAMAFIADNALCRGYCYFSGKETFRSVLQGMVNSGNITEISIVKVEGDTVTYNYKVYRNGFVVEDNADEGETMQVQDGKIIHWNNLHF
jgi:ketosteroid isomerase-like protein